MDVRAKSESPFNFGQRKSIDRKFGRQLNSI